MTDMTIDPNDLDVPGELTVGGVGLELPRVHSTEGSDGLGVSRLLGSTGMVTLDPGFTNTASCTSDITYIDGGAGILRYRGYPIAELAKSSSFLEVAYLLINGELPDAKTLERFARRTVQVNSSRARAERRRSQAAATRSSVPVRLMRIRSAPASP